MAWLRLARISNLPSAISNILVGFLLTNPDWSAWPCLLLLVLASSCLYSAGMILNDVFDFESDLQFSPSRPLPSGQISKVSAYWVGSGLCLLGIAFSAWAGLLGDGWVRPLATSAALACSIWLYDSLLKKTFVAPGVMGLCRTLNILLGASVVVGPPLVPEYSGWLGFNGMAWWVAISIGVYVTGLTLFARTERQHSVRWKLGSGLLLMIVGIAGLALMAEWIPVLKDINAMHFGGMFSLLILLVSVTIVRSSLVAIWNPKPMNVQSAVITSLRSLIVFDACVALLFTGGVLFYSLTLIGLLLFSFVLGFLIKST